jgi:hypothetical protein
MTAMSSRERRAVITAGIVLLLAAVGVVVLVLTGGSSKPGLQAPSAVPAATPRFPAPPNGAVVYAREDQADALALAVVRKPAGATLQASVVGPAGGGVTGLHVSFAVTSRAGVVDPPVAACGAGCYRASVRLGSRPQRVRLRVVRPGRTTVWNVALPAVWPATDASGLVARADRVWRQLHTVSYRERLGADPTHVVVTRWQAVAPDRLAYQIDGGSQAIIIGLRRWDRPGSGGWQESTALRLDQPQPQWIGVRDAHTIGSGRIGGRAVWRISFFDPRTPAWFLASIDKTTLRTLDLHMIATSHFMHDSYGSFDAPIKIVPPTS